MKLLFLAIWFLIFVESNHSKKSFVAKDIRQVDSVLLKYSVPYKADSISKFLEVRTPQLYLYIEKKETKHEHIRHKR